VVLLVFLVCVFGGFLCVGVGGGGGGEVGGGYSEVVGCLNMCLER